MGCRTEHVVASPVSALLLLLAVPDGLLVRAAHMAGPAHMALGLGPAVITNTPVGVGGGSTLVAAIINIDEAAVPPGADVEVEPRLEPDVTANFNGYKLNPLINNQPQESTKYNEKFR
ncbi:hypothetical protein BDV93DRAFT_504588 [Ceratobasidium sp. AG-I]|nr:hypothetical protein BDV93DRAFT_504588 [Ceratobasidium sp. AG-I]